MRSSVALLALAAVVWGAGTFRTAQPGYRYEFPRDHFNHPDFRTEWWYYTGNLRTAEGRRFGFELTFFRHALEQARQPAGVWGVRDAWLAHFAVSDLDGGRFYHTERLNRAGPGLAGADLAQGRVWNGNWQVRWKLDGTAAQELEAVAAGFRVHLALGPLKPPVIHGIDGISRKAAGPGRASHYISLTRLEARGEVEIEGRRHAVEGLAWMDHEFFTHQLAPDQAGWDWFSMQFDDGAELMLFRLRRKDGTVDPHSAGTYIDARGRARHLEAGDFTLLPGATWTSPRTGGRYPVAWKVRAPSLGVDASVSTRLAQQELVGRRAGAPPYWEGAVEISESRPGVGYLEMTGYAGAVRMGDFE